EEIVNLRGIALRLIDTAGLRTGESDAVETEGMARTKQSLAHADLLLQVVDVSMPKPPLFDAHPRNGSDLLLLNKSDLTEHPDWKGSTALRISCIKEDGLAGLEEAILSKISKHRWDVPSAVAINVRHRECLRRGLESCEEARRALENNLAPELVAVDLRGALQAVGEVIGHADMEQVLDSLFAQFCIGK